MRRSFCFYMLISLMLLGFSSTVVSQFGDPVPRYPQEMDGTINVITRVPYFSETEIAAPGRGVGINFTRTYNGDGVHHSILGPAYLGPKWSHSYQWEIHFSYIRYTYRLPKLKSVNILTGAGSFIQFWPAVAPANFTRVRDKAPH